MALGPYAGFLLSARNVAEGSSKISTDAAGQNELMVPVNPNDPSQGYVPLGTQSLGGITDDKSSLHSFNAGIQGGLGAEQTMGRGKVSLEVRGERGLMNIQKHPDVDGRNSNGRSRRRARLRDPPRATGRPLKDASRATPGGCRGRREFPAAPAAPHRSGAGASDRLTMLTRPRATRARVRGRADAAPRPAEAG